MMTVPAPGVGCWAYIRGECPGMRSHPDRSSAPRPMEQSMEQTMEQLSRTQRNSATTTTSEIADEHLSATGMLGLGAGRSQVSGSVAQAADPTRETPAAAKRGS